MTNNYFRIAVVVAAAVLLLSAAPALAQYGPGRGAGTTVAVQPLTAAESEELTYMREEEKLARDLYRKFFEKWNLAIFDNISRSEQRHFDSVGLLLARYGVADPAANKAAGVFTSAKLNTLYNELLAKGMGSVEEALAAGVFIEQTDVQDLEAAIRDTSKFDLKRVYTNLMNASYNHLEAFETGCTLLAAGN